MTKRNKKISLTQMSTVYCALTSCDALEISISLPHYRLIGSTRTSSEERSPSRFIAVKQ